jgi:hypothetical protein
LQVLVAEGQMAPALARELWKAHRTALEEEKVR